MKIKKQLCLLGSSKLISEFFYIKSFIAEKADKLARQMYIKFKLVRIFQDKE